MFKRVYASNSVKNAILEHVVSQDYEQAMSKLKVYVETSNPDYPVFKRRAEKYLSYCNELILAIETKRRLSRHHSLSATQIKELQDNYNNHFKQLTDSLTRMERIERSLKLEDMRSTGVFVRACQASVLILFLGGLFIEFKKGLLTNLFFVMTDSFLRLAERLATLVT